MCEKCGDKGFTEEEHGLVMVACDCEQGKILSAEMMGEVEQPIGSVIKVEEKEGRLNVVAELTAEGVEKLKAIGMIKSDNDSGTGQVDSNTGSADTSQPQQHREHKAKKKTTKRTK